VSAHRKLQDPADLHRAPGPRAVLTRVATGERLTLDRDAIAGRLEECAIRLTSDQASRSHARLTFVAGVVWVEDLGSANGTFLNGVRMGERQPLSSGDRLRFETEEFEVTIIPAPGEPPGMAPSPEIAARFKALVAQFRAGGGKVPAGPDGTVLLPDDGRKRTRFIDPEEIQRSLKKRGAAPANPALNEPHLRIASGQVRGRSIVLVLDPIVRGRRRSSEWSIGADAARDVVLSDEGVSGFHARLFSDGKRWQLTDQQSANGTFVNGKRSTVTNLTSGDRIRFGTVECVFHVPAAPGGRRGWLAFVALVLLAGVATAAAFRLR
jgi:pSer/pThr/pTyr-binding forkhead associated (FHA) protein